MTSWTGWGSEGLLTERVSRRCTPSAAAWTARAFRGAEKRSPLLQILLLLFPILVGAAASYLLGVR